MTEILAVQVSAACLISLSRLSNEVVISIMDSVSLCLPCYHVSPGSLLTYSNQSLLDLFLQRIPLCPLALGFAHMSWVFSPIPVALTTTCSDVCQIDVHST